MDQTPPSNHDPRTDQELIAAANQGDAAAFALLYDRYRDWVVSLAMRFTRDRNTALDVMQDTFLYLLRKFPDFELTGQMKTFLYPVVRHNSLAIARRQSRQVSSMEVAEPAVNAPGQRAELNELAAAVDALDPGHREVLVLRFVEGLSLQEIALAMELPLGTVKSRLHHALRQLRENSRLLDFFSD